MTVLLPFAAEAAASSEIFPPLDPWHFPSQIFWTLLLFGFLYLTLSRFILPKLGNILETRQSTLADDLDEAQRASDQAEAAKKALDVRMAEARAKARETADTARAKIETEINTETAKVDAELNSKLEAAEVRISDLRTEAMANVDQIAVDAAQSITERFGIKTTAASVKSAVSKALSN